MASLSLSQLSIRGYSLAYRVRNLAWAETGHSRGKTTKKSRGGSFAPRAPDNLWKWDVEAILTSPQLSVEQVRELFGLPGPTFINNNTGSRSHQLGSLAVYDKVRKDLTQRFGVPWVDPTEGTQAWHAPALGQLELPRRPQSENSRVSLIQYAGVDVSSFNNHVRRHGFVRATK